MLTLSVNERSDAAMKSSTLVPTLMLFTLVIVLVAALFALLHFLRKRSNRHPMEHQRERNIDEIRRGVKSGD